MSAKRILIAASGTGGHLFPALFIARALQRQAPDVQIEFVGSGRPLEEKLIGAAGFRRHVIDIVGLNGRGLKGMLEFLRKLPRAVSQTWHLLSEFTPDVVVGVGGYASVLPVTLAWLRGCPTWIHEAELAPGMANRFLGYLATKVSTAFKDARMPRPSRAVFTGHPLREEVLQVSSVIAEGTPIKNLLVVAGSQGAESLDLALPQLAGVLKERGLFVRHQSRKQSVDQVQQSYLAQGVSATVVPFFEDMAEAYSWAHVVIGRSGAGTLMELSVVNRPAIFVPLPKRGVQQLPNAKVLEAQGKALVVEEGPSFVQRLGDALKAITNPEQYFSMHRRRCEQRVVDAAQRIATGVLGIC